MQTRRDFLFFVTSLLGVIGIAGVFWPFVRQLRTDVTMYEDDHFVEVDLSSVLEGMSITVRWRGLPVVIRNRTREEIAKARTMPIKNLRDPYARNANLAQTQRATDLARSGGIGRENWLIFVNLCTHLGCVAKPEKTRYHEGWFCPCHGSSYDTAGRVLTGPADKNMMIPPYKFLSEILLRIG